MSNTIPPSILALAATLRSQDNYGTSHPIFQVQQEFRILCDAEVADDSYWEQVRSANDPTVPMTPALEATLDHMEQDSSSYWSEDCIYHLNTLFRRAYFQNECKVIAQFFTNTAAEEWIARNRHNYPNGSLNIYVDSGWKNPEWQLVRDFLMTLV